MRKGDKVRIIDVISKPPNRSINPEYDHLICFLGKEGIVSRTYNPGFGRPVREGFVDFSEPCEKHKSKTEVYREDEVQVIGRK